MKTGRWELDAQWDADNLPTERTRLAYQYIMGNNGQGFKAELFSHAPEGVHESDVITLTMVSKEITATFHMNVKDVLCLTTVMNQMAWMADDLDMPVA